MIELEYPKLLKLFPQHLSPKRTESASFLIWYLENYYRLDPLEAVDSVCDQHGDKGVDGIYVNDNDNTIHIFQAKISQSPDATIGDTLLKEFYGTLSQFADESSIANLVGSAGDADVARLVKFLDLASKIHTHDVRGVFVSNVDIDSNGISYLTNIPDITFVGKTNLIASYISNERTTPVPTTADFDVAGFPVSKYIVDSQTLALIAPVMAKELVKLQGIPDQSLYAFNVRGPLGRTQVNRDIERSIKDPASHRLFPLFHNGITVICRKVDDTPDRITIEDYFVVNGCQSLDSLYKLQPKLTDDLRILTKFVQMDISSPLSERVTMYSNNQNGVKPRDFKANSPIQIRLQNEFRQHYSGQYSFEIKRGETADGGEVISNEIAGLYLMSWDLKEPWATHRKYQVFDDKHAELFARPAVSADRIVMCHVMMEAILDSTNKIKNSLFGKYALTYYALLYMLRCIMDNDPQAPELLSNPATFVRDPTDRQWFASCIAKIVDDIIVDVNAEVDQYGDEFDYRGKLRDADWVRSLSKEVVSNYLKLVQRNRIPSFAEEWHQSNT